MTTFNLKLQVRQDTEANWVSLDPVPLAGEWCLSTDTTPQKLKIGNGVTAWSGLTYCFDQVLTQALVDAITGAEQTINKGQPNGYASLDATGVVPLSQIPDEAKRTSTTVADITARDALTGVDVWEGRICHVVDATADATVTSSAATYIRTGVTWTKITEWESMDIVGLQDGDILHGGTAAS